MAALGTFISGRYSTTWNAVDLGLTEEGYTLRYSHKEIPINRSDAFGDTLIDAIYRGGDWMATLRSLEYKAGPIGVFTAYSSGLGVLGTIGVLASGIASSFVMTSTANTPAAAAPATLTASASKLSPSNNVELLFNSDLRRVPLALDFLLYSASGTPKWFTTT